MTSADRFDWSRVTPFQRRVYEALLMVPPGCVTTYALLAGAIGCRSPRAIGQALRRNPFAPGVPCHRVIASDLTLGGFAGRTDSEARRRKEDLLEAEGVRFLGGALADPDCLHYVPEARGTSERPSSRGR